MIEAIYRFATAEAPHWMTAVAFVAQCGVLIFALGFLVWLFATRRR